MLGLIGGVGPESTMVYYRGIVAGCRAGRGGERGPRMLINSVDNDELLGYVRRGERAVLAESLGNEVERLARAGATFAAIAAWTPHLVFEELSARCSIPLISIVETACDAAAERDFKRIGMLGTRFVMQGDFVQRTFAARGMSVAVPLEEEQVYVHAKYFDELYQGVVMEETREGLTRIVAAMKERDGLQALLLAGTELSLVFDGESVGGLPVLDATRLHIAALVERSLGA